MRFIKLLLLSVLCFGVLIFLISLLLPSKAIVERSGVIDAPLPIVYAEINDLNTWPEWNPWAAPGVAQQIDFSRPAAGQVASYTWSGVQQERPVSGKVFIRESAPEKGVFYNMEFNAMKPVSAAFDL